MPYYYKQSKKNHLNKLIIPMGALLIPSIVNRVIFEIAKDSPYKREKSHTYQSFLGRVNYRVQGRGKPVVLIHDTFTGGGSWEWDMNMDFLAQGHRVYAMDLPGYGLSQKSRNVYSSYDYTRLIKDFIKDVVGEKTLAIASGSSAAFLVQAAFIHGDLFEKLIIISPTGVHEREIMNDKRHLLLTSSVIGTSMYTMAISMKKLRSFLEERVFFNKDIVTEEVLGTCHFYAHAEGSKGKYALAAHSSGYLKTGILASFQKLKLPILTVWGEENTVNPIKNMDILEGLCPDRMFASFEKTRMLPHYENSHGFNELAEEFLDGE